MTKVKASICLSLLTTFSWCMFGDIKKIAKELLHDYSIEETHSVRERINKLSFEFMETQNEKLLGNWIRSPFLHARSLASYGLGILDGDHEEHLKEKFQLDENNKRTAAYGIKHIVDTDWGKGVKVGFSGWLKDQVPYSGFYWYLNDRYAKAFLGHVADSSVMVKENVDSDLNLKDPLLWAKENCPDLTELSYDCLPKGPFYTLGMQHISVPWMYGAQENGNIVFDNQRASLNVPSIKISTPISIEKTDDALLWATPLLNEENSNPLIFIGIQPHNDSLMENTVKKLNLEYIEDVFSMLQKNELQNINLILPQFCFEDLLAYETEENSFELKGLSPYLSPQKGQVLHQTKIEMVSQLSQESSFELDDKKEELIINRPFIWLIYAPKLNFIFAYGTCYDPSVTKSELLSK